MTAHQVTTQAIASSQPKIDPNQVVESFALFTEDGQNMFNTQNVLISAMMTALEDLEARVTALEA
jgi:hypothetical protein